MITIDLPMRLIQKNNIPKFHIYNKCKNTLQCYYDSNNKKSFIVQYNQEWQNIFLIKNIDNTYIDFSIVQDLDNDYIVTINEYQKHLQKYKIKYLINKNNLDTSTYCKYSIKNIISEILLRLNYSNFKINF